MLGFCCERAAEVGKDFMLLRRWVISGVDSEYAKISIEGEQAFRAHTDL